jgi:urease accessory protein
MRRIVADLERTNMASDWLLWQLADSAFPSGGFVHSGGLEAAVQLGAVSDATTLERLIQTALVQLRRGVARFTLAAWNAPHDFVAIDQACDLFLNSHISNRSSRAQGQALLATASKVFADVALDGSMAHWAAVARRDRFASHLSPVFGLVAQGLGIAADQTNKLFLFTHLRGFCSAAVRLGVVGPMEAQKIQSRLAMESDAPVSNHEAVQISPLLDLMLMNQDRFYSRLFQS